jgi:hypothetical protein
MPASPGSLMLLALALAATVAQPFGPLTVSVTELSGLTPAETASHLHVAPGREQEFAAIADMDGHRVVVVDPTAWVTGPSPCGRDTVPMVLAPADRFNAMSPRLVFVDGRLTHVKSLSGDYLAHALDNQDDVPAGAMLAIHCTRKNHMPAAETIIGGAVIVPLFGPWAAYRSVQIASGHGRGRNLLAGFRFGEPVKDLGALQRDNPGVLSVSEVGAGRRLVRIRFGNDMVEGGRFAPEAFDYYIELAGDRVVAFRQGFLLRQPCRLRPDGGFACG